MSGAVKKRALLLMCSFMASLLLAEAALQVFYPTRSTILRLDESLLFRPIPGARKLFVHHPANGGERVWVRIDSRGFRGDDLGTDDSAMRVVVYGDSCIMAEFSKLPDTFAEQLEDALEERRAGRPVEVINAGVVAYGPDQAFLRMKEELARLKPQLAILALFADNDLGDLVRNKLFRLGQSGELEPNPFIISHEVRSEFRRAKRPLLVKMIARQVERIRRTGPWAQGEQTPEAFLERCEREYRDCVDGGDNDVRNVFEDFYDADAALDPDCASAQYKIGLLSAVLKEAASTARRAGVPLVVLVIPSPIDVCERYPIQVDPERHPAYRRETLTSVMAEAAARAELPCLNLFAAFRAGDPDALYFQYGDDHWNAAGQRLAAREMAEFLCAREEAAAAVSR